MLCAVFSLPYFLCCGSDYVASNNLLDTDSVTGDIILRYSYTTFWNEYSI